MPIVQDTVQAFLRMEGKGLVAHITVGRTFVHRATVPGDRTKKNLLSGLLDTVSDGAPVMRSAECGESAALLGLQRVPFQVAGAMEA